ncbi:MAG: hypothetical protein FD152_843 [Xanthobacteraceae bacterium]|nr:MAG: hypothetical protein FD152_843 [Xanthobacteraceae bacterium]
MTVSLASMKAHLNITEDTDDDLIGDKIAAAQAMVEEFAGEKFADMASIPAPLLEATRQIAAHFYENREATAGDFTLKAVPFAALDLIRPYKRWVF